MLHYSRSAGYAIHALSCIGTAGKPSLVRDIASCTGLQKPYLSKIINQLAHHRLIKAKRGFRGGVSLGRAPEKISLLKIVKAVDRNGSGNSCLFGLERCPVQHRCPVHKKWNELRRHLKAMLTETKLSAFLRSARRRKRKAARR